MQYRTKAKLFLDALPKTVQMAQMMQIDVNSKTDSNKARAVLRKTDNSKNTEIGKILHA